MRRSKRRRKSSVNQSYALIIVICVLSFIMTIKKIFINLGESLSRLPDAFWLSMIIFVICIGLLSIHLNNQRFSFFKKNSHKMLSRVDYMQLSTYEFEKFCAEVLNRLGWKVRVTPPGNDGGKDLIGTDDHNIMIFGEVKQWTTTTVGRPILQKLKGSMVDSKVNKGIFITSSKFSAQAIEYSKRNNIQLIDRIQLDKLIMKADNQLYRSANQQQVEDSI